MCPITINEQTAVMLLVGVGDLPADEGGDVELGTLVKVVGSEGDIRTESRAVSYTVKDISNKPKMMIKVTHQ